MKMTPNGATVARRNHHTHNIDQLATLDMLTLINEEDKRVAEAVNACLADIARLVDNASATVKGGGRVVIIGAGESGLAALQTAAGFAQDSHHGVVGLMAGQADASAQERDAVAADYELGSADLQAIDFSHDDLLVALSVSGKTPWTWGALHYAWSLGARTALVSRTVDSEAAQLADIVLAADCGAEVVSGFSEPKARQAQQQILTMLATGLAIRTGRVYSNLRVDVQASNIHWAERQIALVMAATNGSREAAKKALRGCEYDCRSAIVMLLTELDAWQAKALVEQNQGHVRLAVQQVKTLTAQS
ncbi:N-acetylmuramic acid 6-phosphate etherase [Enterobacter sp. Bisph1]|uniref:N-acetylmuramic acid 6-phosphate etherase n=1 Tax=Enterobacter sp. Bisph1 TaxID=1274399 RepID=UPI00057BF8A7|nr:N-acetylmuramic acid 6-phosphate etherase [Enterobacter sp. Bisph1]